jgi:hypothetical protein
MGTILCMVLNPEFGAAAGIWTRVRGLGGLRRGLSLVSVLNQVAHRAVTVLDHGLAEALVLTHPRSGPFGRIPQLSSSVIKQCMDLLTRRLETRAPKAFSSPDGKP